MEVGSCLHWVSRIFSRSSQCVPILGRSLRSWQNDNKLSVPDHTAGTRGHLSHSPHLPFSTGAGRSLWNTFVHEINYITAQAKMFLHLAWDWRRETCSALPIMKARFMLLFFFNAHFVFFLLASMIHSFITCAKKNRPWTSLHVPAVLTVTSKRSTSCAFFFR